ncbi:MAG: hypothetical protein AAGE01_18130 [Pseudomonadota bacterium]
MKPTDQFGIDEDRPLVGCDPEILRACTSGNSASRGLSTFEAIADGDGRIREDARVSAP